ncbi:MAG: glycosyltransferase family 39 protein [Isosphaeraceae bacterium]
MSRVQKWPDAARFGLLALFAMVLLGWLACRAEIFFADGLRYIDQARRIAGGNWSDGIRHAVDHPVYPLSVAAVHRLARLADSPEGWQTAAQAASVLAGVLLVGPLYLVAREFFGRSAAWLGCLLVYAVPLPPRVMADALSESTFLFFWCWGVWATLRYLKRGEVVWLVPAMLGGALAYLVRPEGLLLPLALVATLLIAPVVPSARLSPSRWWAAVGLVMVGPMLLVGPFVALKGGIGTKPAVARLLGLAPASRPDAVERERPLEPDQTAAALYGQAVRAAAGSVGRAVSYPLLPFAALGLAATARRRFRGHSRAWVFLGVMLVGASLALVRLHATGGYCTPRHALIVALPLIAAAAAGLRASYASALRLAAGLRRRRLPLPHVAAVLLVVPGVPDLMVPLNSEAGAYRDAGHWLARHVAPQEHVVDLTGWSLYYGARPGYVFANLHEAPGDRALRWVVAREAHVKGPWGYCEKVRGLLAGAKVVARFPAERVPGRSQVTVFERPLVVPVAGSSRVPVAR